MIVELHHVPHGMLTRLLEEGGMIAKGLAERIRLSEHVIRFHLIRLRQ